jgi:hypothetical protein
VVFGKSGGFGAAIELSTLDGSTGFRIDGSDAGDRSGGSVSGAGDVNGDGFDDLIIGAHGADPGGSDRAGESYVLFGGNFTGGAETQVGDATANTLTASQGAGATDVLIGGQGNDTLIGDGGPDVLRGGEGDDTLALPDADFSGTPRLLGGNGNDTLRVDGSGITLDLTSIRDNRVVDIEVIDICGSGDNTLTLDQREVLNLSSHSNTVLVRRDRGDSVHIGGGWIPGGIESIGIDAFAVYRQGPAVLKVQVAVAPDLVGVHRRNKFFIDHNGNGNWDGTAGGDAVYKFGGVGDLPVNGDFNGDGYDEIGVYRPGNSKWYLDSNANGGWDPGVDTVRQFGVAGVDVPVVGDWNGDGTDDVAVRRNRRFLVDANGTGKWETVAGGDAIYSYGVAMDASAVGDWNADGFEDLGVRLLERFLIDSNGNRHWDSIGSGLDDVYIFGEVGQAPATGDWAGNGADQIGTWIAGLFRLDWDGSGTWDRPAGGDVVYSFGLSTDTPIVGKWPPTPYALDLLAAPGTFVGPTAQIEPLTQEVLAPVVQLAIDTWSAAPLSASQQQALIQPDIRIADLPGAKLGQTFGSTITFDLNAARWGWDLSRAPRAEDGEPDAAGAGRMDLVTAVMHELGHVLGYDHAESGVMQDTLSLDARHIGEDGWLLDDPAKLVAPLDTADFSPAEVDKYFAAK